MSNEDRLARYEELFSGEDKARAFDKIANQFYAGNFGTMAKSDMETLMFSIYIEQILSKSEDDFHTYSDFRLAKELGITQSRVSSLKVKKQLQYPHEFRWRDSFARVSENARYENGKIKIQIPDINLYYEIKNAVEEAGGYIDVTLTPKLLQISPEYFLDLLVAVSETQQREQLRKELRNKIREKNKDREYLEAQPLGRQLAGCGKEIILDVLEAAVSGAVGEIPVVTIARNVMNAIKERN